MPRTPLHFLVAATLLVAAASTPVAPVPLTALFGDQGRFLGLTFMLDMAVLYAATAIAVRRSADAFVIGAAIAIAALLTMLYAFVQWAELDPLLWTDARGRPFSTLGNPNIYGHFLSLVLGLAAGAFICARGPRAARVRALAGALVVVTIATAAVIATRGTVLGILAVLAVAPFIVVRVRAIGRRAALTSAVATVLVGVVLTAALWSTFLGVRVRGTLASGLQFEDRIVLWRSAVGEVVDRPLLGYGPDSFRVGYGAHRPADGTRIYGIGYSADSAHDWLLQTAATTGLLGLACGLALVFATLVVLWIRAPSLPMVVGPVLVGSAGYWANALVSVGMIGVDWWPWLVAGLAAALTGPPRVDVARFRVRRVPRSLVLAAPLTALALAAALGTNAWVANAAAYRARQAVDVRLSGAVEQGEHAVSRDANRADYWNELGRALFAQSRWAASADAFAAAVSRAPYDATYWTNLALARVQRTNVDRDQSQRQPALDAARLAVAVDPNNPLPHAARSNVALALGDTQTALDEALIAYRLAPGADATTAAIEKVAARPADPAGAYRVVAAAIQLSENARLQIVAARLALLLNDRPAALTHARRAVQLEPNNPEAQRVLHDAGG